MKSTNQLFYKTMIALSMTAIIFAACKKSDAGIEPQPTTTTGVESQSASTRIETQSETTDNTSTRMSAQGRWGTNVKPNIKTGPDQTYTTAVSSITLNGSGSNDPDGSIISFLWTKDFGTDGLITSPNSAKTTVTGLTAGQYRFKLTITDNKGAVVTDTIHISNGSGGTTPPPPPGNQAPVVNAGSNQTIISPASSVTLSGSATDADGTIASYLWTKVSGTGSIITSPNAASSTVTGLTAGSYVFNLKATDNAGANGNKTVTITVSSSTPPPPPPTNQVPVVNAGSAQTISSPASSVTLNGSATDADGTIASYLWTKVSGTGGTISSANSASTTVTGLTAGSYSFNLRATDNAGGAGNKTVSVLVNAATPPPPPPPAGYTLTFSSGYDTQADMLYQGNGQYGSGTISTSVYKIGPGSFYSRPANVSSGIRSEVQYSEAAQNPDEGAIEYDVMYEVVVANNGHSVQWHPETSGGSASPGLWHMGGKFVMVNWKGGGNAEHATGVTIQTQHWYHMRMEYKKGSSGYFNLYIDGVKNTGGSWVGQVGDNSGSYLKVGYNGWDGSSTSSRIYYDNLKVYRK